MQNEASKPELRTSLRQKRQAVPDDARAQAAINISLHAAQLPCWNSIEHVALYLAADGEIATTELAQTALANGASLYLPVILGDDFMQFARWQQGQELVVNRYGIPEPGPDCPRGDAEQLDIVFLPLVGWAETGARLGMGGGYYDRALSGAKKPLRVGLGFECQKVEALPTEDWDIPLDFVVTEAALYDLKN